MHDIGEIPARRRALSGKAAHRVGALVIDDAVVPGTHQPAHDVAAHPAEADHAELHCAISVVTAVSTTATPVRWPWSGSSGHPRHSPAGACATTGGHARPTLQNPRGPAPP